MFINLSTCRSIHQFLLFHTFLPQYGIPWKKFFDLESLQRFVRVIEFEEYLEERFGDNAAKDAFIDQIFYLQQFPFDGNWESRIKEEECKERNNYEMDEEGRWRGKSGGSSDDCIGRVNIFALPLSPPHYPFG